MRNAECGVRNAAAVLACMVLCAHICPGQVAAAIPESEIAALQEELEQGARGTSSVDVRRACKSVIRKAEAMLDASPGAPNRFALLVVIFNGQKRLLSLDTSEQNRAAIFETCTALRDAPDEYAEPRFEADMILSERDLSEAEATVAERVSALEQMLAKYRGTAAEWKSLVVGSMIATKLLDFDLEKLIGDTMAERFGGDHKVIEFRRKKNLGGQIDAVFSGTCETSSGATVIFPYDRMGHQYVLYFWSQTTPELETHVNAVRELQAKYPGRFEVYSFNVDELPDAGEKKLREMGLNWTPLRLPGGTESPVFRAYARATPLAVSVNGQGHVLLVAPPKNLGPVSVHGIRQGVLGGWNLPGIAASLDDERYLAQLRYLFIGDFLVADSPDAESVPAETLTAIQSLFTPVPFRYRLSPKDSLANYRKAEKLCTAAIKSFPKAPGVWAIRNRRIVALLGMWNLTGSSAHLAEAVKEARTVLEMGKPTPGPSKEGNAGEVGGRGRGGMPPGSDVVARFCLAKEGLRNGGDPEALAADIVAQSGGDDAPAAALAAAAILALESNARTAHEAYRARLLDVEGDGDPLLWPVYAFLRDSHHRYRNFWATPGGFGYGRPQKYEFRNMVSGLADPIARGRRWEFELKSTEGGALRIPDVAKGEMLGVVFAEPPPSTSAASNLMKQVRGFAKGYTDRGVKVLLAFVSDDTGTVNSLTEQVGIECQVGMLRDGLRNPLVQKLGILSADKIPNLFLLRDDGTVAWGISGLRYRQFRMGPGYSMGLAIGTNIEKIRSDVPFEALERGDYRSAVALFAEALPDKKRVDYWTADRLQGRALAFVGLKEWDAALSEIDAAIDRRLTDFRSGICKCHGLVEMYLTKAMILENLGRGREAAEQRRLAAKQNLPHAKLPPGTARQGVPVGVYYDWLKQIRLGLECK